MNPFRWLSNYRVRKAEAQRLADLRAVYDAAWGQFRTASELREAAKHRDDSRDVYRFEREAVRAKSDALRAEIQLRAFRGERV